jgi:hypothetical protein
LEILRQINSYVTSKIHEACRTVGPERIGHDRIKTAGQPKQISELDASFHSEAGPAHERGIRQAENDGDLAGLVWKYFAEEISEALMEVQKALAPEAKGSSRQAGHRKG